MAMGVYMIPKLSKNTESIYTYLVHISSGGAHKKQLHSV